MMKSKDNGPPFQTKRNKHTRWRADFGGTVSGLHTISKSSLKIQTGLLHLEQFLQCSPSLLPRVHVFGRNSSRGRLVAKGTNTRPSILFRSFFFVKLPSAIGIDIIIVATCCYIAVPSSRGVVATYEGAQLVHGKTTLEVQPWCSKGNIVHYSRCQDVQYCFVFTGCIHEIKFRRVFRRVY